MRHSNHVEPKLVNQTNILIDERKREGEKEKERKRKRQMMKTPLLLCIASVLHYFVKLFS